MKISIKYIFLGLAAFGASLSSFAQDSPKGHLFIIGGGTRTPELMSRFAALAGGKQAKVFVLPMASAEPASVGREQAEEILKAGAGKSSVLDLKREDALTSVAAAKLDGATGIFFSGGDQSRLTKILLGTPVLTKLRSLYEGGAVIGGTSAGAAVMSALMITGDELINKNADKEPFPIIKKGNVQTTEGFGFIDWAIVDQHFVKRKRHNRLIGLVLEHPNLLGIGIDESTAIIVNPDRSFEVVGENTVLVYDASRAANIGTDRNGNLAADSIQMHILSSGATYPKITRK